MPLTDKGEKIMGAMQKEYGAKEGESVFYASKNAGRISGVDSNIRADDNGDTYVSKLDAGLAKLDALGKRLDGLERRDAQARLDVDESYWTYKAGSPTPSHREAVAAGAFRGTESDWHSLTPGMRREIVRSHKKDLEAGRTWGRNDADGRNDAGYGDLTMAQLETAAGRETDVGKLKAIQREIDYRNERVKTLNHSTRSNYAPYEKGSMSALAREMRARGDANEYARHFNGAREAAGKKKETISPHMRAYHEDVMRRYPGKSLKEAISQDEHDTWYDN